jgi:hypothetical protein
MKLKGRRLKSIDEVNEFDPLGEIGVYYKGGSSAPENTTTTTITEPPEYVKPYSVELMERAGALSNAPFTPYTGQRIAGLTPEHTAGLNMTTSRALQGSPLIGSAQNQAENVFNNNYLDTGMRVAGQNNPYQGENPYLENMIGQSTQKITNNYLNAVNPKLDSMDRMSGAFGNTGVQTARDSAQENLAKQLADTDAQYRYQNYQQSAQLADSNLNRQNTMWANERNNQMGAMQYAPTLAQQDYIDAQNLLGVGDIYRGNDQQNLDYNYDQWQQAQNWPYQNLDVLAQAIRTSMGGGGSHVTSAPNAYSANSTANMIGTGLMGYGALQSTGLLG